MPSNSEKKNLKWKEAEYLYNKLFFLDDVVELLFEKTDATYIKFYVSDQDSCCLIDYSDVYELDNYDLADAIIKSYEPTKKENYYGQKAALFILKRHQ